jgi:transposase
MSRAIQRLNWAWKKKTLRASEQNEADRATWREHAKRLPASKLVFIDECGSNIALTRAYARSLRGKRAYGAVPRNRRANITLLAALSLQGMGEAFILEGSADATVFELYIERVLAPSLQPGQIVILDNLNTHTGAKVRQAIEARGCQLLFLPSYSPDLSPIEEAFSKLKAFLRQVGARTPETLQEAIGQALLTITAYDAHGWFRHCGYLPQNGREHLMVSWVAAPTRLVITRLAAFLNRVSLCMSASGDGADGQPGVAFEECPDAFHLVVEITALRCGELVERLHCDIEPTTRAPLMPDPSDCSVDEQHWKVSGLTAWGQCAFGGPSGKEQFARLTADCVGVEVGKEPYALGYDGQVCGISGSHPCQATVDLHLLKFTGE